MFALIFFLFFSRYRSA